MPKAVAEIEQMSAVVARQRLAVLAEVGDIVEAGREPRILRLDDVAATRIFPFAEIKRESQLMIVGNVLISETQHRVVTHSVFDFGGLPRRQRLSQIDAGDLAEKMRVQLPDRDG